MGSTGFIFGLMGFIFALSALGKIRRLEQRLKDGGPEGNERLKLRVFHPDMKPWRPHRQSAHIEADYSPNVAWGLPIMEAHA